MCDTYRFPQGITTGTFRLVSTCLYFKLRSNTEVLTFYSTPITFPTHHFFQSHTASRNNDTHSGPSNHSSSNTNIAKATLWNVTSNIHKHPHSSSSATFTRANTDQMIWNVSFPLTFSILHWYKSFPFNQ